jgi:hypothetical protein
MDEGVKGGIVLRRNALISLLREKRKPVLDFPLSESMGELG